MADRGRDLKISILSDTSKFDLDKPVKELKDTGDAAEKMAKDVDASAEKVDKAFDQIAKSAKAMSSKVDKELEDAGSEGLGEFKDEAASTGKEAAASFSGGFDDIAGGIQELAANAFAGFGPAGAAAGIAAGAGIGLITSVLQKGADEANALKDRVLELAGAISEAGGNMAEIDIKGMIRDWSLEIADNKSWWEVWQKDNTSNLEAVEATAKKTGLAFEDLLLGMSGNDPKAATRSIAEIDRKIADIDATMADATQTSFGYSDAMAVGVDVQGDERIALVNAKKELLLKMGVQEDAIDTAAKLDKVLADLTAAEEAQEEATRNAADAQQRSADVQQRVAEAVTTAAQQTAEAEQARLDSLVPLQAAIEAVGQAEITRKDDTIKSVDEIIAAQEKEIKAKKTFESNVKEVFKEVGQAGVDWALEQGPNAAAAMKLLADAPKSKQKEIVANYTTIGKQAGAGVAAGLSGKESKAQVRTAAQVLADEVGAEFKKQDVRIPVGVDGARITTEMQLALAAAEQYSRDHPVPLYFKPGPTNQRPQENIN